MTKIAKVVILMLATHCVIAEETRYTYDAYAAGYTAAFTCSATFNGGKTGQQIKSQELSGIYRQYQEAVDAMVAEIDHANKRVSVRYSPDLPPRIAQWRPHLGCTQLPVGGSLESVIELPTINLKKPPRDASAPWQTVSPINGSSGNRGLDQAIAGAFQGIDFDPTLGKDALTTAVLIATPDQIIAEHYIDGYTENTSQRTWSVAKSIAATIIGIAVEKKILDPTQPAQIGAWQNPLDPRRQITLENLLHMASGLDSNRAGNRTDRLYLGGGRVVDTALGNALEVQPGDRWKYANNDTLLAVRTLREALNNDPLYWEFPFTQLLYKIGMHDTYLETDWQGDFILSSQVWTTARDMARLGVLYLLDGSWNGERILPAGWVQYVSTPAAAQPRPGRGNSTGYGAQFWLYNERYPAIPNDAFAAHGNRGQYLMIIPSANLVIIRRGHDPDGGDNFNMGLFTERVLNALGQIEKNITP